MNEENDVEVQNNDNTKIPHPPGLRKIFNGGKKAGKKVAKNATNAFKNLILKIWMALPSKAKIIVIIIIILVVLFACAIVVLADYSVSASERSVTGYVDSMSKSSTARDLYDKTGSLLLMKDVDIKNIAKSYLEDTEISNNNFYMLMKKEYGSDSENQNNAVSLNEKKVLYEHFLNTEKYNFNRITWVKYDRSKENGTPNMKVDNEIRLQYPEDSKNTTLQEFAKLYQPYMQNYIIPYSIYSGLITDTRIKSEDIESGLSKELNFGYELINNAYHKIQINQYNMQSYTKVTSQDIYDVLSIDVSQSKVCKGGVCSDATPVFSNIKVQKSCEKGQLTESDPITTSFVKYKVKYAKVFDKYIINEYQYTEYDLNNESDDQVIQRTVYKDENYEKYENKSYSISDDKYSFNYDSEGNIIDGTYTATENFTAKKGYTDNITYVWKDTLEQLSHEERAYTIDDIRENIGNKRLSPSEVTYYEAYEYKTMDDDLLERLNTFDIMNAKKDVYSKYLRDGENHSENIGYSRAWMSYSFYTLKQAVKEQMEKESGWKYFYGSSIGAEEATASGVDTTTAVMNNIDYSSLPIGKLGWPSPGKTTISSHFRTPQRPNHNGIDISMPIGSTFVAAASGKVTRATKTCTDNYGKADALESGKTYCGGNMGNNVWIKVDGSDTTLIYMHMTNVIVNVGDQVIAGQAIGTSGSTGRSTGPHAHFEVRVGGTTSKNSVDPCKLFDPSQNFCKD